MESTISQTTTNQNYKLIFEAINSPLLVIDNRGQIVDLNAAYISSLFPEDADVETIKFHHFSSLKYIVPSELYEIYQSTIQSQSTSKSTLDIETRVNEKNNYLTVSTIPICDDGLLTSTVFVHENKTEFFDLTQSLIKNKRRLNELQEVAGLGSWELDLSTGKADWTKKLYHILGYEEDEVDPIPDNFLSKIHKDDKERALKELERPFNDDTKEYEAEFRLVMPDGYVRHVAERGKVIKDENEKPLRFVGTTLDITRRKKAEEELKKYKDHLEELVHYRTKELESFSHSLSHDLRAPLRGISGFCSVLEEDYKDALDETAKYYLQRVVVSTDKMNDMISGMLSLAGINRMPIEIETFNLSHLVQEIVNEQLMKYPDKKVEVQIQQDIILKSDPKLMMIALQNLVDNALKYSKTEATPKIQFGVEVDEGGSRKTYFVRDNGIGFDMNYEDKLYATFKRLHSNDQFDGLGIGLSTVKKIFSQLNGEVWAESTAGEGATFYFSFS